ncbi:MAG: hypothetical protein V4568_05985 [Pseudomonadota bacterium]
MTMQSLKIAIAITATLMAQAALAGKSEDTEWQCQSRGASAAHIAEQRDAGISLPKLLVDIQKRTAVGSVARDSFSDMAKQIYGPLRAANPDGALKAYYSDCMARAASL